jgi:hypothetical protein
MNLAHYKMKYRELPLGDGMFMADQAELRKQQRELVVQGHGDAGRHAGQRSPGAG